MQNESDECNNNADKWTLIYFMPLVISSNDMDTENNIQRQRFASLDTVSYYFIFKIFIEQLSVS